MKTKLSPWTMNTKKWREENGCTTPEWKMYIENRKHTGIMIMTIVYLTGIFVGLLCPL